MKSNYEKVRIIEFYVNLFRRWSAHSSVNSTEFSPINFTRNLRNV